MAIAVGNGDTVGEGLAAIRDHDPNARLGLVRRARHHFPFEPMKRSFARTPHVSRGVGGRENRLAGVALVDGSVRGLVLGRKFDGRLSTGRGGRGLQVRRIGQRCLRGRFNLRRGDGGRRRCVGVRTSPSGSGSSSSFGGLRLCRFRSGSRRRCGLLRRGEDGRRDDWRFGWAALDPSRRSSLRHRFDGLGPRRFGHDRIGTRHAARIGLTRRFANRLGGAASGSGLDRRVQERRWRDINGLDRRAGRINISRREKPAAERP